MISLLHFPVNDAWGFVFHAPRREAAGTPIRFGAGPLLYPTRAEGVTVAEALGMTVHPHGRVSARTQAPTPAKQPEAVS